MKINDNYAIKLCVIDVDDRGVPGNVYDHYEIMRKENPEYGYRFGYYVVDLRTGLVPEACNDWNDSPEEALADYYYNCT